METQKKRSKLWLIALIAVVLAAAAIGGYFFMKQQKAEAALEAAYAEALALEQSGRDAEALEAYLALGDYLDVSARAEAVQVRMDFAAASAVFTGENFDEAIAALQALGTADGDALAAEIALKKQAYLDGLRAEYTLAAADRIAAGAWHTAAIGQTPWIAGDARYQKAPAEADKVFSGLTNIFFLKDGKVLPTGETFGSEAALLALTDVVKVAGGLAHGLFLHENGTVTALGSAAFSRTQTADWANIADIAAGAWHSVGLRADGTAVAIGGNEKEQCETADWADITAVAAGLYHTVGLRADGTVVAVGDNAFGQCDVSEWTDIVAISCGACTTVGLKADGTVVAVGDNAAGQTDVSAWTDVAAIAAGAYHTVGLRLDGTLVSAGAVPAEWAAEPLFDSAWQAEAVEAGEKADAVATAYVQGEGEKLGPWSYLDANGAALIAIDDSLERPLFRTDMLATANSLPTGRVTTPEATGNIIHMEIMLPEEQARANKAVVTFTGDYIGFTRNRKAVMIRNGITYYDRAETTTLAILPDGTLAFFGKGETNAETLAALGVKDSFSFGPLLVNDGKSEYIDDKIDGFTMRVGFGYSDPYHYVGAVTLRDRVLQYKLAMIAEVLASYGCRVAYNMDGGHSTSLSFMGNELSMLTLNNTPHGNIRGLSDVIVFLTNGEVGN